MKNYFPFSDYDFYAYLTSGSLLLGLLDFSIHEAAFLVQTDWTFVQIVLAVSAAYVVGHLVAIFAQLLLETIVFNWLLTKPVDLQLGMKEPNILERCLGLLVGRYYDRLAETVSGKILEGARVLLATSADKDLCAEEVFQAGFRKSFSVDGARARIDQFRNQYGFCRNITFVSMLAVAMSGWGLCETTSEISGLLFGASLVAFLGMFLRYLKFYAIFQAEVIRCLLSNR